MAKSLSKLWLRGLRQISKIQRTQQQRALKSLLPKPARRPAAKTVKAIQRAKPASAGFSRKASLVAATPITLAGRWQKSFYQPVTAAGTSALSARPRRLLYWLYLPAAAGNIAKPLPLVVMLHGCQQGAVDIAQATRMNALAERQGFAVLYPQQSASVDANRCWRWYQRSVQAGEAEVAVIAGLISHVQQRHALDASRTYATGLSAGAALAGLLALRHPQLIAAVALHSAPVMGTADSVVTAYRAMQSGATLAAALAAAARLVAHATASDLFTGMPALVVQGTGDAVVRPINAIRLEQQFLAVNAGCITSEAPTVRQVASRAGRNPQQAYTLTTHYANTRPQIAVYTVANLAHAWSGGAAGVRFSDGIGPDASKLIWLFFKRHRKLTRPQ